MSDSALWNAYGLAGDPYSVLPLAEGGALSVDHVFVGRQKELDILMHSMEDERVVMFVNGDIGVGKTSLLNFHKHLCRTIDKRTTFFAPRREIEATSELLHKKSFLMEILSALYWEVKLLDPTKVNNDPLLQKIGAIVDFTSLIELNTSASLTVGIASIDVAKSRSMTPPMELTINNVEHYLQDLVTWIRNNDIGTTRHGGIIIHVNNFDVALRENAKAVQKFFDEVRDVLQMKHLYFFLLGPPDFYRSVAGNPRIRSICAQPLFLSPLSKTELHEALTRRYERLRISPSIRYISPLSKESIFAFYDIFHGDIRSILAACKELVERSINRTLQNIGDDEALMMLGTLKWEEIEKRGIDTPEFKSIVDYIADHPEGVIQKDVAKALKKVQSNVSGYYFKPLKQRGIIEEFVVEGESKLKRWKLTRDFWVLYHYKKAVQAVHLSQEQMALL